MINTTFIKEVTRDMEESIKNLEFNIDCNSRKKHLNNVKEDWTAVKHQLEEIVKTIEYVKNSIQ